MKNGKGFVMAVLFVCITMVTVASFLPVAAKAQDVKSSLFMQANLAMKEAKKVNADILAPKAFSEGVEFYRKAQAEYEKGKKLADIRKYLNQAVWRFEKANETTKLANVAFGTAIAARADAYSAESPKYAPNLLQEAEAKFTAAGRTLEGGDLKEAQKVAKEAEKLFRDAELKAIKINYLDETYALLKEAEKTKIAEFAPLTLTRAQSLVKEAERELNEDRYDTDKARILARQAKREARHAIFLGLTIKDMREKKMTWENLMLDAEKPLSRIAGSMNMVASFENGTKTPTEEIVKNVKEYQKNIASLNNNLFDASQANVLLEQQNAELQTQLGDVATAKSILAKKIEKQAQIRQLYDDVEALFTGEVAVFIRKGNDVIIQTVGLSFPVGKATIEPKYYDFLTRVGKAIAMFPDASIIVEGHTDSYGSDETNLKLSNTRAEAVKGYLTQNLGIDAARVESVGYGESRPTATNETEEGRARNRRIEIIIHPRFEDGTF